MEPFQEETQSGILNETTMTLHKQESGMAEFQTPCGHVTHIPQERLQIVDIGALATNYNTDRCGKCFEDAGGY